MFGHISLVWITLICGALLDWVSKNWNQSNHKEIKSQWELRLKVNKPLTVLENTGDQFVIGFASDWLRERHNFFGINNRAKLSSLGVNPTNFNLVIPYAGMFTYTKETLQWCSSLILILLRFHHVILNKKLSSQCLQIAFNLINKSGGALNNFSLKSQPKGVS